MPVSHPEESRLTSVDAPSLEAGMLLRIQAKDYPPQEVHIRSPRCSIGSGQNCTLRLVAKGVEPLHCVIVRSDRQARVERAAPGAWLNHREFHSAPFQPGDRLQVGPIEIQLVGLVPESKRSSSEAPRSPAPPLAQQNAGAPVFLESFRAEGQGASVSGPKPSPKPEATERPVPEQTARRLGHQRAKHLVRLLRQARQEIVGLQTEIVQLRQQLEGLRRQDVSARALEESQKEELWNKRTQLLADLEARLTHRQRDLDRREAQWESQREAMERQWAQWKDEQEQLRQELQRQAQTLQQQQAELLQSKKALEEQLRQLEAQQQTLYEQQQRQFHQQQALQTQQEAAAEKQQELAAWQQRLETQEQALADQQAALAQQQAALAQQQQLLQRQQEQLEKERQERQEQNLQGDPSPPEVGVPQERIERYTRPPEPRSASSAEEVLRRLGMMPELEEQEEDEPVSTAGRGIGSQAEISPTRSEPPGVETSETDEEGIVHAYMERLLGRGWKQAAQPHPADPQFQPDVRGSSGRTSRQTKADPEAAANEGEPQRHKRRGTAEWVPRAVAPERGVDLEAMRDLANLSASSALEHHQRRKALADVWAKFLVSVFSLLLGCGMLWVWGGNQEHDLALYAAGACFAVAALWGVQYFLLAGKLILRSFGFRSAESSLRDSSQSAVNSPLPSEADTPPPFGTSAPTGVGPAETASSRKGEQEAPAPSASAEETAAGANWQAEESPPTPEPENPSVPR